MSNETKITTHTQHLADSLRFAHNRIVHIHKIVTEDEWAEMMLTYGERYALLFSLIFGDRADTMASLLTDSPPEQGCRNNWFWMWWRWKWMYDDWVYITNKIQHHQQPTYQQYKCYMLNDEKLEEELVGMLHNKQFFNHKIDTDEHK